MDLDGHTNCVTAVVFTSDGSKIVSGSDDGTIKIWDGTTGEYLSPLESHTSCITSIAISAGDKYIVSSSSDHTIKIWDIDTKRVLYEKKIEGRQSNFVACINDPIGVVYNENNSIRLWHYESNKAATQLLYEHNTIVNIKCCKYADGYVAFGSDDGAIIVWKIKTRSLCPVDVPDSSSVVSIALCNLKMIAAFENCSIMVWRLNGASCSFTGKISNGNVGINCIAFTHDSNATVFGSKDRSLKIVRHISDQVFVTDCLRLPSEACSVACNHNTSKLVAGFDDGKLTMWDINSNLTFFQKENVSTGNIEELNRECERLANMLDCLKRDLADVSNEREVVESLLKHQRTEMVTLKSETDKMVESKAALENAISILRLKYDELRHKVDEAFPSSETKDFQFINSVEQSKSITHALRFADGIWSGLFIDYHNFTTCDRHVIVKEEIPSRLRDIKSESEILIKLNEKEEDSCCVKIYGANFVATPPFIVLEHFGRDILKLNLTKMDISLKRVIIKNMFKAITRMHALEVVHCDIKPQNILVDQYYNVKLCDFDSARYQGKDFPFDKETKSLKYSEQWVSPEVYLNRERGGEFKAEFATDVFSAGLVAVLLECRGNPTNGVSIVLPERDSPDYERSLIDQKFLNDTLKIPEDNMYRDLLLKVCCIDINERYTCETIVKALDAVTVTKLGRENNKLQAEDLKDKKIIISALGDLKDSVDIMNESLQTFSSKMNELYKNSSVISNKLDHLRKRLTSSSTPTFGIIIKRPDTGLSLCNEYFLYFLCEYSLQPVTCGPEGRGFHFKRLKVFYRSKLKKMAPVFMTGLVMAKIVVSVWGIPIPLPGLGEVQNALCRGNNNSANLINNMMIELGMRDSMNKIEKLNEKDPELSRKINDIIEEINALSEDQLDIWHNELNRIVRSSNSCCGPFLDENDQRNYGLVKITNRSGHTKWINPAKEKEFSCT